MENRPILVRVTTVDISLWKLLEGQLKFMSNYFEVYGVSSQGEKLAETGSRENINTHSVAMYRGISPLHDLKAIWSMYKLFSRINPSIVHSHTPKAGLVAMVAASMARVPIKLHTIAGLPLESRRGLKKKLFSLVEKVVYFFSDRVYPNSNGLKHFVIENDLCPASKLKIIGNGSSNGIDLDHFKKTELIVAQGNTIRDRLGIENDNFIFLFVGRIVKDKGIEELVQAFDIISQNRADLKLILLGRREDHLDPISADSDNTLNNNKHIIYEGYQLDIRPFLAMADCFVFPTYREGLPNVLLQACAFNLPVIASRVTGNTDIISEGENGLFFEAGNTSSLLEKMNLLLSSPNLRDSMSQNSRTFIKAKYNREFVWDSLLNEYKTLLEHAKIPFST